MIEQNKEQKLIEWLSKFKNISRLICNYPSLYCNLKKDYPHLLQKAFPNTIKLEYLTLEQCKKSARKYKTKKEWREKDSKAYGKAYRKHWLKECCRHMQVYSKSEPRPHLRKYNLQICKKYASKYNHKSEWRAKHNNSYIAAHKYGWLKECCKHMKFISYPRPTNRIYSSKYSLELCKKQALKYKGKTEWFKKHNKSYMAAYRYKWIDKCCEHMRIT